MSEIVAQPIKVILLMPFLSNDPRVLYVNELNCSMPVSKVNQKFMNETFSCQRTKLN